MGIGALVLLAVGLSMDAFAVSVCKGLAMKKATLKAGLTCGLWFGGFQALMPLLGYFLGKTFASAIQAVDHWIAFGLLAVIGFNMLKEAFCGCEECEEQDADLSVRKMFPMAIATSIDALAVGITFAFLKVSIIPAVSFIGITTFTLSAVGLVMGNKLGARSKSKAELVGGVVLICMGAKILLEHLGFIG